MKTYNPDDLVIWKRDGRTYQVMSREPEGFISVALYSESRIISMGTRRYVLCCRPVSGHGQDIQRVESEFIPESEGPFLPDKTVQKKSRPKKMISKRVVSQGKSRRRPYKTVQKKFRPKKTTHKPFGRSAKLGRR